MKKKKKGQALVEFAIILPILLLLVMAIAEFSMMLNAYLTIQNASREGSRQGIMGANDDEIVETIYNLTTNLEQNRLTIDITPIDRKSGDTLNVSIKYRYQIFIPIIKDIAGEFVELKAQTSMRIE